MKKMIVNAGSLEDSIHENNQLVFGSLFSGIGGFEIAAEWAGWKTEFFCEWNNFGKIVLKKLLSNTNEHNDITKTDFSIYRGRIDVLTGGFPCQPYSVAGKRKGSEDERHLWPEMLRAIREIQPRWVVGENVRGLINWNAGLVFHEVQTDLEAEGYKVLPFLLPAAGVNAPHERYRIWFVAYAHDKGSSSRCLSISKENEKVSERNKNTESCNTSTRNFTYSYNKDKHEKYSNRKRKISEQIRKGSLLWCYIRSISEKWNAPNTNGFRLWIKINWFGESRKSNENSSSNYWANFPTQSPVCDGNDGFPLESLRQRIREDCMGNISEKEVDQIFSKAYVKWRNETIKGAGNAIVPQLFFQIAQSINEYELNSRKS